MFLLKFKQFLLGLTESEQVRLEKKVSNRKTKRSYLSPIVEAAKCQ
jgi:hypothetical protein